MKDTQNGLKKLLKVKKMNIHNNVLLFQQLEVKFASQLKKLISDSLNQINKFKELLYFIIFQLMKN